MNKTRSELRESIMTILYQISLYDKNKIEYDSKEVIKECSEIESEFINTIVNGVLEKSDELESLANKYLTNWTIDRLGLPDKAILKSAIYEMLYTDTPDVVCINEAIELGKKYSDDNVVKMINSVLDKIMTEKETNG